MSSALAAASLILKPEGYSEGTLESLKPIDRSGDFTFTRGSNLSATRVNSAGLIEKGRENLLLQSNQFDTTWLSNLGASGTIADNQSGYDGSNDAWLLTKDAKTFARVQQTLDTPISGVWTMSAYLKAGTATLSRFRFNSASYMVEFNFSTGIATDAGLVSAIDYGMTDVGNGWYRCYATFNASVSVAQIYVDYNTSTSTTMFVQDAQLEAGMVATDYIETGASTGKAGILENTPRLDYSGGATEPSLLLEPQRTNQCSQSEYIGSSDWSGSGNTRDAIITQTSEINPEGAAICWKFQGTSTDNQLANNSSTTSGTTITNSIYVKRVSGTGNVILRDVNNSQTSFSLSVADGWKRIDATATATSTTARFYLNLVDYNDEILVWGAQQEQGSYPTSYIPTYGSSETRSKDTGTLDMITAGITTGWTSATLFIEYEKPYTGEGVDTFRMHGTSTNGRAYIYNTGVGFASDWAIAGGHTLGETTKHIWRLDSLSEGTRFRNGAKENTGSGTAWSDIRYMYLNNQGLGGILKIKQILLFPSALSDAKCITLTTL